MLCALSAVIGSAATIAFAHRHNGHESAQSATAKGATTTSSPPENQVARVGEPTVLNGWTIVAEKFGLASVYERERAASGRKWLVTQLALTNSAGTSRSFDLNQVVARYAEAGAWTEVPARLGGTIGVGPKKTIRYALGFSVPNAAQIFTLVIRKDLQAEKHSGDAVEIDLNCC
jgi:hypothetical protein